MKAQKILKYIIDLYDVPEKQATQMLALDTEYEEAFKDIEEEDLKLAVKNYWKYKSDKTRPTLSKILAMLPDNIEKKKETKDFYRDIHPELKLGLRNYRVFKEKHATGIERDGRFYFWQRIENMAYHVSKDYCKQHKELFDTYNTTSFDDKIYFLFLDRKAEHLVFKALYTTKK